MDILNRTDVQELIEVTGKWCISLYMPSHPIGWEQQQNTIRLKNLLARVRKDLSEYAFAGPISRDCFILRNYPVMVIWPIQYWQKLGIHQTPVVAERKIIYEEIWGTSS
ncbi:MAG: hypothetical protein ACXW4Q_01175 [Anaerolineales bacterium]